MIKKYQLTKIFSPKGPAPKYLGHSPHVFLKKPEKTCISIFFQWKKMSSLIEIKAANEFTIHYSTEDTLGPHRVQRTKNVMLISPGESLDLRNHESSKSFSKLKISCNGSNTRNDLSYFWVFSFILIIIIVV